MIQISEYFKSLDGEVKVRYVEKCKIIKKIDPYTLKDSDFNCNVESLPSLDWEDIYGYYVLNGCLYTKKQFKAVKSLKAYEYYDSGFVSKINCALINGHFVIVGEVC